MTENRIGIIGSGLGGLAAACTLAARGYRTVVFEKNEWTGGKAAVLDAAGFRFDMGPTILIYPQVLRRIFAEAGVRLEDELRMQPLEPQWRCFYGDGGLLDLFADEARMREQLAKFGKQSASQYERFLQESGRLHRISREYFFWRPVDSIWDTFELSSAARLSVIGDISNMRMGKTVAGTIRNFVKDPKVAQMLDHFTQYIGSAPAQSPAVLCAIAHMQVDEGVWYPEGGIAAVPRALRRLAERLGVEFRTGVEVERVLLEGDRACGVKLDTGETVHLAAVVSNSDAVRTYRELVAGEAAEQFEASHSNIEPACSGVVLYLGLNRRYEHLAHHNFVFSRDPEAEFESIYHRGEPAADLTAYLCAPSVTDRTVAPEGGEALYVLVHTPYLRPHHDWKKLFPQYRRTILEKLKRDAGLEDIESRIVFEAALTPQDIHDRYRVLNGAIYGVASHGRFTGAFKPGNISKQVKGLYLCGGAAHPGPGTPMVMMSGWIAADALDRTAGIAREERLCPLRA